jgi:hypothetical protein
VRLLAAPIGVPTGIPDRWMAIRSTTTGEEAAVSDQDHDRAEAAQLPEGDLVAILLTQHATVRDLLEQVSGSSGQDRKQAFDRLAGLLKAHETAEESVVRPVSEQTAGAEVAQARNAEEDEADEVIAKLRHLDVDSADFDAQFADHPRRPFARGPDRAWRAVPRRVPRSRRNRLAAVRSMGCQAQASR